MPKGRWDQCVYHTGDKTTGFLGDYLAASDRRVLLICGAGFDPRSTSVPTLLGSLLGDRLVVQLIKEERPSPNDSLVRRAEANEGEIRRKVHSCRTDRIEIFASDMAVVGGRNAVKLVNSLDYSRVSDIFVDMSALSLGVAFPVVKHLSSIVRRQSLNLHLLVVHEPSTDSGISATLSDVTDTLAGFKGGWGLDSNSHAVKLWMPQLAPGKRTLLDRIHRQVNPHAVCPILPFPASNPRLADELIDHYSAEFANIWQVDSRDIVYASEGGPLDLYRTILRTDDRRRRVFVEVGGSQIVLSPVGSKALSVGALMAALERDFTIMHVESLAYEVDFDKLDRDRERLDSSLLHIWLWGDVY